MPLSDPTRYRDKTLDWSSWFGATRRAALARLITPELIAEHARDPAGQTRRHSTALQEVLNHLRAAPTVGKPFAYIELPYRRYRIGRMGGRGVDPKIEARPIYAEERAAIHAVFLARLEWLGLLPAARRKRGHSAR